MTVAGPEDTLLVQEHTPGETFDRSKQVALEFDKRRKIVENTSKRFFTTTNVAGITMSFDLMIPTNPVCEVNADFDFGNAAQEAVAKQILPLAAGR